VTDETAPTSPEHKFGDAVVIIDHKTGHRPYHSQEYIFRVKRLGMIRLYRIEVHDEEIAGFSDRRLAEYLLRHGRHKSLLFAYKEA
jgi:hypothetical protein